MGNDPDSKNPLKNLERCPDNRCAHFFKTETEISLALSFWRLLIIFSISSRSQGAMKMLPGTLGLKNFLNPDSLKSESGMLRGLEEFSFAFNFFAMEEKNILKPFEVLRFNFESFVDAVFYHLNKFFEVCLII